MTVPHITIEQATAIVGAAHAEGWAIAVNEMIDKHNESNESAEPTEDVRNKYLTENTEQQYKKIEGADHDQYYEPVEPHAELKALYAQQVKDGTVGDFVWTYSENSGRSWGSLLNLTPSWRSDYKYRCTPKPTCQIKNLDTGELKTMTREAAKLLQAETKDVCDWFMPEKTEIGMHYEPVFKADGIYTYKLKSKLKAKLVKLNGKLMSREAAIALWESKKDTCDCYRSNMFVKNIYTPDPLWHTFDDVEKAEYELREKPKKPATLDPAIREGVIELLKELNFIK